MYHYKNQYRHQNLMRALASETNEDIIISFHSGILSDFEILINTT